MGGYILHQIVKLNNNTIKISIKGSIEPNETAMISLKVLKLARDIKQAVNIILDTNEFSAHSYIPVLTATAKLEGYINRFNYCYIVDKNKMNHQYAEVFLNTIGSIKEKVLYFDNLDEALVDSELRGTVYYNG